MKVGVRILMAAVAAMLLLAACNRAVDTEPPSVSITTPAEGATVVVGAAVEIAGTSDDNRFVRTVEVLVDDELIGELVPAEDGSWSLSWVPLEPGPSSLTAVATDQGGHTTTSAAVGVIVEADATVPGTVSGTLHRTTAAEAPPVAPASVSPAAIAPGGLFISFGTGSSGTLSTQSGFLAAARAAGFAFETDGDFEYAGHDFEHVISFPGVSDVSFYRIAGLSADATRDLRAELQENGFVASVFPNWILEQQAEPADPMYGLQAWHYGQLNLPAAWDIEDGSTAPVQVAVLDTGSYVHPDLEWGTGVNFTGFSGQTPPDGLPFEDPTSLGSDHGTHVAGTIGALSNNEIGVAGVNWGLAPITPVKVLGPSGSGALLDILMGVLWAAGEDNPAFGGYVNPVPAQVINLSLGASIGEPCPPDLNDFFASVYELSGTISVIAAGNSSSPTDPYFPGNCPAAITVGATGPTGARAYYSNYGPHVDVMAPGGDLSYPHPADPENPGLAAGVLSTRATPTDTGFGLMQGTSMAAPHVAGVVSLLLSQDPDLTLDEVRTRLQEASWPMTIAECAPVAAGFEGLNLCGAGLLDAAAALQGVAVGTPTAVIYAVPFDGEAAPEVTMGDLGSLEHLASLRAEGEPLADGGYSFAFSELAPGSYQLIGVELRRAGEGVGMADRYASEVIEVQPGASLEVALLADPVWLLAD